jgi:formylmethanofuran dehydrogenase subunit E
MAGSAFQDKTLRDIWIEKRNALYARCDDCGKKLGNWLLWHRNGKPLCDSCERKSERLPRKTESDCDSAMERTNGIA